MRVPFLGAHSKNSHQHQQRPPWLSLHIIKPVFHTQITTLRSSSPSLFPLFKLTPPSTNAYRFCSKFLHCIRAPFASSPLIHSPEIVTPLCAILPTIASAHPDPVVRQQTFQTISSSHLPTDLRIQLIVDLTGDSQLPQMCVAAVDLVRRAIIESLSSTKPNQTFSHHHSSCVSLARYCSGPVLWICLVGARNFH